MALKVRHYIFVCRNTFSIFSTPEAEELLFIIVSFFLDRQLLGLSVILHDCMLSALNFFRYEEWHGCCNEVAKSLASRCLYILCQFANLLPCLFSCGLYSIPQTSIQLIQHYTTEKQKLKHVLLTAFHVFLT